MPDRDQVAAAFDTIRDAVLDQIDDEPTTPGGPDEPGEPDTPAGSGRYPADVLDLRAWKVTLPVVSKGKVVEIFQPALATYTDKYFDVTDAKDGARFRVWHGGGTTSNSSNPRSELREMLPDGSNEYDWSAKTGKHTLEVVGQVNRLTKVKPHVVIAQIHGGDDDVTVWRVEGTKLYVTKGDDTHAYLVDGAFQLGKRYTIRFDVENGKIAYTYNGTRLPYTLASSDSSCYFKAGNYLQSNPKTAPAESSDEYSEVVVYSVRAVHTSAS